MHIHILGICGTFMAGVARLASELGYRVTGSDTNVYPPMSTQLQDLDIIVSQGYGTENLDPRPDLVVIGNAMSRGNPEVEATLNAGIAYTSGPQWIAEHILPGCWTLAIAGTHGKTTTSSLLSWILQHAGCEPGFLIGGVPENFGVSARLGGRRFFVIEADEYDSAFFDKRSKCIHYRPRTAVLNNVEFDHADIFNDLGEIRKQLHHFIRTVPGDGLVVYNADDKNVAATLELGCWSRRQAFSLHGTRGFSARLLHADGSAFEVIYDGSSVGRVEWQLFGEHNVNNALAAIAAASHAGVEPKIACAAAASFLSVKRRLQPIFNAKGINIYDDFAHHPTAIRLTLDALRKRIGDKRIIAVIEPRSNTMRMGVHKNSLPSSLAEADLVISLVCADLDWDLGNALGPHGLLLPSVDAIVEHLERHSKEGDHIVIMSNGGFGGLSQKLVNALSA